MILHSKIVLIPLRILGVIAGLVLLVFALAYIFITDETDTTADRLYDIFNGVYYILLTICLLVPNSLIKSAQKVARFFHFFLTLAIIFTLTSFFFAPPLFGIMLAIVILSNVWVSYVHYQKLLET